MAAGLVLFYWVWQGRGDAVSPLHYIPCFLPGVLAFVLAPMFEQSLQQSLIILASSGAGILGRPIASSIFAVTLTIVLIVLWRQFAGWRAKRAERPLTPPA